MVQCNVKYWKRDISSWVILLGYASLIILRLPEAVWPGRFWAEEGTIYFYEAVSSPFVSAFFSPNLGYYSLWNKIAVFTAAYLVPLEYAPVVTMCFALVVQLLPAVLLLYSYVPGLSKWWQKILALAIVLSVQPSQEVWLNTINSQFFFCVSSGIILLSYSKGRYMHGFRLTTLWIAGLTGIPSCLLLPFFILYCWKSPHKMGKRHEAFVLGAACLIQAAVVLCMGTRHMGTIVWEVVPIDLFSKQWLLPFLPDVGFAQHVLSVILNSRATLWPWPFLFFAPYIAYGFCLVWWKNHVSLLWMNMSLGLVFFSLLTGLHTESYSTFVGHVWSLYSGGRYYYAPNVFLGFSLLCAISMPKPLQFRRIHFCFRAGCACLLGLMLLAGLCHYRAHDWWRIGPSWRAEVEQWRRDEAHLLCIWPSPWPEPWVINLKEARMGQKP